MSAALLGAAAAGGGWDGALLLLSHMLWVLPLLCLCAFFAGTETALFSLSVPQREALAAQAQAGDPQSGRILWLLQDPRRLITTLILGNELVNISLSSLMTSVVHRLYQITPLLQRRLVISEELLVALCTTALTVPLLIVFGELTPKTVALKLSGRWAQNVATPVVVLTWALWLPRQIISGVAGALIFLFGGRAPTPEEAAPVVKEREFRTLVDLGSQEGEIEGTERRLIHNVFEFGDLTVGKVMTPAERVFALPVEMPLARLVHNVSQRPYSRIPLYKGRKDNVVGVLFAKDLVGYAQGHLSGRSVRDLLHPPLFVPRRAKCERLFREFQRRKTHMALVVDEYGRLAGLVTMEDLLLSIFRDVPDPAAAPPPPPGGAEASLPPVPIPAAEPPPEGEEKP